MKTLYESLLGDMDDIIDKAEQQTMYEYVEKLENQYYQFLEDNPEAKEYLEEHKDEIDDNATKTTIIHEILHSCEKCMNHGPEWKKLAELVNKN